MKTKPRKNMYFLSRILPERTNPYKLEVKGNSHIWGVKEGAFMKIRQYQPADQDAIWALHKAALHNTGADLEDGQWDADLFQIEEVYLDNQGAFFVGEIENRIVAMGAIKKITSTRSEIKRMRVHPDFQKRGLGQMMLAQLEARAIALGYHRLQLDTTTLQVAAQQLYRKNGFVQLEKTGTIKGLTVLFFEKYLRYVSIE